MTAVPSRLTAAQVYNTDLLGMTYFEQHSAKPAVMVSHHSHSTTASVQASLPVQQRKFKHMAGVTSQVHP